MDRGLRRRELVIAGAGIVAAAAGGYFWLTGHRADPHAEWALLGRYCFDCHNQYDYTAEIAFDRMTPEAIGADPALFEKVVRKLRGRMMPPPGRPKPSGEEYDRFVGWMEASLDEAEPGHPNPGQVALHRLNRKEYANAIRDLLAVDVDPASLLPKDDDSDGFDNIAAVLKVSPTFLDQYITAARVVASRAVGDPGAKFDSRLYFADGENQSRHIEGMPLGTRGGIKVDHFFPVDGEYEFDVGGLVSAGYTIGMEDRHDVVMLIDGRIVFEHAVGGERDLKAVDQGQAEAVAALRAPFENIRLPVSAGEHEVAATFVARSLAESDDWLEPFVPGRGARPLMSVGRLEIAGPLETSGLGDTPSRRKIFVCRPESESEELPCARRIVARLARLAFRRPVTADDLEAPMRFFAAGRSQGGSFDAGIRNGLIAILVSPKFLFRAEPPPPDAKPEDVFRLTDLELASRLAFFLWSSLPDDELLDAAEQGRLHEPEVLHAQVERMLADPRAQNLVTNFAYQWLRVGEIADFEPDPALFPNYDADLGLAFEKELELFLDSVLLEDHSVLDLIDADYTFVNERLARFYGMEGVRGDAFRRVKLDDANRRGLFGKAGVLMITSYPNRTAPVLRGAYILDNITGTPPASPPPDVPALPETQDGQQALTVRERLEKHRENPTCNLCHGVMDPLGFALENFDAIGEWRTKDRYAGDPIDSSGRLADGTAVNGPQDLQKALLARSDLLVQTVTEKLMTFALGRNLEYYDMPTVRAIVREADGHGDRFSSILMGIVDSQQFQYAKVPEAVKDDKKDARVARNRATQPSRAPAASTRRD
jgi:hypothetical protein